MKDSPLKTEIKDDKLIISIGIDTLAFCAEHCPELYNDETNPEPPFIKVADNLELAKDVMYMINKEEEDGTTPLHILLDEAIIAAIEDGSLAFDDGE